MADWNIHPRAALCTSCQTPFVPGMPGHSLLEPTAEGYRRLDLCEACFAQLPKDSARFASGAWTFVVPKAVRPKQKEEPVQRETAEHLLRVLTERGHPADRGVIYVLAILLERNKQFVERQVTTNAEGLPVRLYEQRGSGDLFPIVDPQLTAEDLPAVQQRVLELLEGPPQTLPPPPRARVRRKRIHPCHSTAHRPLRKYRV